MHTSLVFDLDGTLLDTSSFAVTALIDAVEHVNHRLNTRITLPSHDGIRRCFGLPLSHYYKSLLKPWSEKIEHAVHEAAMARQRELLGQGRGKLYRGVVGLLARLHSDGFMLAVVSLGSSAYIETVRENTSLRSSIGVWISASECMSQDKAGAIRQFGISSGRRILAVIGDRSSDMLAARKLGVIGVGCLYGYGTPEEMDGADHLAESPSELGTILLALGHTYTIH